MQEKQKFQKGDYVRVAKDLGSSMSHFPSDCNAIVIGSYADQFGGKDIKSYTLFLENRGESSWYEEWQLELIEASRLDLLDEWEKLRQDKITKHSNLDWIFANGKEVLENPTGASMQSLANCIIPDYNLWGNNGEGFVYHANVTIIKTLAEPFLLEGNKDKWVEFAKTMGDASCKI